MSTYENQVTLLSVVVGLTGTNYAEGWKQEWQSLGKDKRVKVISDPCVRYTAYSCE